MIYYRVALKRMACNGEVWWDTLPGSMSSRDDAESVKRRFISEDKPAKVVTVVEGY